MNLPWREYQFLVSETLKSSSISNFYFKSTQSLFDSADKKTITIESSARNTKVDASYATFEHAANTIIILKKEGRLCVGVWDTKELKENDYILELFLQYSSMDSNSFLQFSDLDITLGEAEKSKDFRLKNKAESYIRDEAFKAAIDKREVNLKKDTLLLKKGECLGACESLKRNIDYCNFLESRNYKLDILLNDDSDTKSIADDLIPMVVYASTRLFNDVYGKDTCAEELYEQINYVYEKGLSLTEKFYFNDNDYSVWREHKDKDVVCLKDQEILFVISKKKDGKLHVQTTAEHSLYDELVEKICYPEKDNRTSTEIVADLALLVSPNKVELLGSHLYSLAIDARCAVESMMLEIDGIDPESESDELDY